MSRKNKDGYAGLAIFILPALLSPILFLAIMVYAIGQSLGLHPVLSIIIFIGACYISKFFINKKIYFWIGLSISTLFTSLLIFTFTQDLLWTIFISSVFAFVSWWLTDLFILNEHEEDEDSFRGRFKSQIEASDNTKPSNKRGGRDRKLHKRVGFCQGFNVSSTSRGTHDLYRCGNCGHAGCADRNCPNFAFSGTNCSTCNHMANFV